MKSNFLSAQRSTIEEVRKSNELFNRNSFAKILFDSFSNITLVIDKNRQIVFVNKKAISFLGKKNIESILGLRPGELLKCTHSINKTGGCGTDESCKYCGAAQAIQISIEQAVATEKECRISVEKKEGSSSLDLLISATPIKFEKELFVILSISDISDEKRRKILERVFFHDVINTASGLRGVLRYLSKDPHNEEGPELIDMASVSSEYLLEEILSQRSLVAAENRELKLKPEDINPTELLDDTRSFLIKHDVALGKKIEIDKIDPTQTFFSDPVILKRILVNLLKNALEASREGDAVRMGFEESKEHVTFWVWNKSVMPEEIKLQIFQRSFSTKGVGRGIGTYSIKLFTETYLKGKVSFTSEEGTGTVFRVVLPWILKIKKY